MSDSNVVKFPELAQATAETSHEYAYLRLRHALMVGAVSPGISITIRELADELGISATPVREALRQLASENALVTLKNRRIQVPEMTPTRLRELISLRCNLEVYAARRALPYINLVLIETVEAIDASINDAIEANDWISMVTLNQRFHSTIYLANPENVVMPMIESLWLQLGPFMGVAARSQDYFEIDDHHQKLTAALRSGDEDQVAAALENDIRQAIEPLLETGFEAPRKKA